MAHHTLIENYLAALAERLPVEAVEELADGLEETFQRNLDRSMSPDDAATAAIAEFGQPAQVVTAFARHAPGRRTAVRLLATGPIFAALWGTTLITAQAWTWPIPLAAVVAYAAALLMVAGLLAGVATTNNPRTTSLAAPASATLILLDTGMLATVVIAAPAVTWPMTLAIPASLTRITLTARNLPQTLAR